MNHEFDEFEHLVDAIKALPSIGTKNARKIAFFLLKKDSFFVKEFIRRIMVAKEVIKTCIECGNWSRDEICEICSSENRDKSKLCILATVDDLLTIELCDSFNGLYHVLGGELSKQKNIEPDMLNIATLKDRIKDNEISEILIATNFTIEGERTANFLKLYLKDMPVSIYRIGLGLPANSSIDYADETTLKLAIENKLKIK